MNRQRTMDNGQRTFLDTELVEVPKRTCAFDKLRHRSLPVAHCSLLIAIFFILCSCSTNKSTSNLRTLSANHILREVEDNKFEFDKFETKFNVKVEGISNIGLKGQLRMQNDSVIWISLSLKMGIELGRVMITEDSVKLINRTEKTYLAESIENFKERLPSEATISFLQDMLVGNEIQFNDNEKFKASIEDNSYKLTSEKNTFWVTPKTFKVNRQQPTANGQQPTVIINYDNFQEINGKLLPTKIILETDSDFNINIEIDYSEIKVGEKVEFPFNISKKYSRI